MVRLVRRLLAAVWEFSDSLELAALKKKMAKEQKAAASLRGFFQDSIVACNTLKADLETSEATRKNDLESHLAELRQERDRISTLQEHNKALRERNDSLELALAEAKATIILNTKEKAMMADLHSLLQARVNSAIAATADAYGGNNRSRSGQIE